MPKVRLPSTREVQDERAEQVAKRTMTSLTDDIEARRRLTFRLDGIIHETHLNHVQAEDLSQVLAPFIPVVAMVAAIAPEG